MPQKEYDKPQQMDAFLASHIFTVHIASTPEEKRFDGLNVSTRCCGVEITSLKTMSVR